MDRKWTWLRQWAWRGPQGAGDGGGLGRWDPRKTPLDSCAVRTGGVATELVRKGPGGESTGQICGCPLWAGTAGEVDTSITPEEQQPRPQRRVMEGTAPERSGAGLGGTHVGPSLG